MDAPTEQYPIAGTSYKVRCKVKANPAPLVDWYKEDTRIQDGNGFVKDIDGLLIQNVTAEDDGLYKCRAIVLDTGNILDRDIRVEVSAAIFFRWYSKSSKFQVGHKFIRENSILTDNLTNRLWLKNFKKYKTLLLKFTTGFLKNFAKILALKTHVN